MNLKLVRWADIYIGIPLVYLFCLIKMVFLRKPLKRGHQNFRKILLVKFWGVGNVLMLLPSVMALKNKYPGVKIDFFTLSTNFEAACASGLFDNIYTLDIKGFFGFCGSLKNNICALVKLSYDLVIDFEQFARFSVLICAIIKAKDTIGFKTSRQHRHSLYTDYIVYNNNIHITESFYDLVRLAGVKENIAFEQDMFSICKAGMFQTRKMLEDVGISLDDSLVVIHPGTSENFSLRRWPPEYFSILAGRLINELEAKIIFTGILQEKPLIKNILSSMKSIKFVCDLSGKLDFSGFVCLINLSQLVVCADTAPVHLASCLSKPVIGLYGPNTPFLYGPWGRGRNSFFYKGLSCSPCITNYNAKVNRCRHPQALGACMRQITPDEVFLEAKKFLKKDER